MSMNRTPNHGKRTDAKRNRRRRAPGVPAALVAGLLVIALFFGGLMGFVAANKTNTYRSQLAAAQEEIVSLRNTLTMLGFSDTSNLGDFAFDDSGTADEFGDLSGAGADDGNGVLWNGDGLAGGMMEDGGEPVVVAEFNGGELLSSEVVEPYNDEIASQAFGFADASSDSAQILQSVMENLVADKIARKKAEELGLTELTAEDTAAIEASMQASFDEQKALYKTSVDTTGMTAEQADEAVTKYMEQEIGLTLSGLIEAEKTNYWREKLFNEVTKDVTATDEEIQASYDDLLASQTQLFTESPDDYEFAIMSGEIITYNLEGYRRVKHILLTFDNPDDADKAEALMEQIALLDPAADGEQIAALQEELDALYAALDQEAEGILAELEAGADFDDLIAKYGEDDNVEANSKGYYVSANSTNQFTGDFVEGCMMLENIGDVSVPVHSVSGVHIIKYVGDVTPGAVPLADLRGEIEAEVLADKRESDFVDQEAQWITDADVKYYPERLQ